MGLFSKKIGPVFMKEDSDAEKFIEDMSALSEKSSGKLKKEIDEQIRYAKAGLVGENNIIFELKNSGMDMIVLHDIYLESDGNGAQIDFLIITRKRQYVIECKNLIGNITVNNDGSFVREYEFFGKIVREGIYSPITQNERHRVVIKGLREKEKGFVMKYLFNKNFDNVYVPIVVLANPKTILDAKYAPKDIKSKIIRADQLVKFIKDMDAKSDIEDWSVSEMESLAQYFIDKNISDRSDYARKYREMLQNVESSDRGVDDQSTEASDCSKEGRAQALESTGNQNEESSKKADNADDATSATDSIPQEKTCPRCGNALVLRTATKGDRAGKRFYGCSSFPKCRYIENID